jgi:hypothetical protein
LTDRAPRTTAAVLALALAVGLLLAGCGGGGDETGSSGDTQPVDQLVSQADAICTDADKQRPANPPALGANPSPQELKSAASFLQDDLTVTQHTLDQLSALAPPEGLEDEWSTVLDGFRSVTTNYPDLIDAAKAGDKKAFVASITAIQDDTQDLQPAAAKLGLKVCATA